MIQKFQPSLVLARMKSFLLLCMGTLVFDHWISELFTNIKLTEKRPAIIHNLADNWNATAEWVSADNNINWRRLKELFGDSQVQVALCSSQQYNDQQRVIMRFSEFIEAQATSSEVLYVKDWHLVKEYPNYKAYITPTYFSDDWINHFWDVKANIATDSSEKPDDYRFVYMGRKGSFTPLHCDVFRSFSWSTNVIGTKKWTLFSIEDTPYLYNPLNRNETLWDIREWQNNAGLQQKFPNFSKAKPIEIIQRPGETIFVPSGWFHQVENIEDTVSINHNWGNVCNVDLFWDFLVSELSAVERELADCKDFTDDWIELCQRLMLMNSGMDFNGFCDYLLLSAATLIEQATTNTYNYYILFNLTKLSALFTELQHNSVFQSAVAPDTWFRFCNTSETVSRLVNEFPQTTSLRL